MITSYLFLKSIRTRITLPFQSNITLTIIRFNSSSSNSSSDSSSDSDSGSDSEVSNKDKENNKVFKPIEYLESAKVAQKKRQIEKEITKAAQILTTTSTQDKEKVLLPLLNKIGNIQNANNTFTKSNIYKDVIKDEKINWKEENNIKNSNKNMKYQLQEKSFLFQNEKDKTRNINKFETKYDHNATKSSTSIIKMVQKKSSIIGMLKNQQEKMRDNNNKFEIKNKSSIIRLKNQQKKIKNIDDKYERKIEQESTIKKFNIQEKMKDINNKFEIKTNIKEKPFIKMLKQEKVKSIYKQKIKIKNIDRSNADDRIIKYRRIFNGLLENSDVPKFKMWDTWEKKELQFSVASYPKNAFQEMIEWTKEGKLWKFPIDNEQGMEDEYNVHFSKHVFLEHHLVPWCPSKGPIRHFMELVCVGLSKNPYMKIEEKYDHIMWYKNYFKDKQDLLQKLGIIE